MQGWLLSLIAVACATTAFGGDIALELATRRGSVGESIYGELRVENFEECEPPEAPRVEGLRIVFTGIPSDGMHFELANGRTTTRIKRTYSFEIIPQRAGRFEIPPFKIVVDGEAKATQAIAINVLPSDGQRLLWAEVTAPFDRAYVGQKIPLTLTIYVKPAVHRRRYLDTSEMKRYFSLLELGVFRNREVRISRKAIDEGDDEPTLYYLYKLRTEVTAEHPGMLRFDDIIIGMRYPTQLQTDFLGNYHARRVKNIRVSPDVAPIEIMPLPTEGRPDGFTGAIGKLNIRVLAEPRNVRVGDPIELTIDLFGDATLETLPPPNLAASESLTADFRVPNEELAGETTTQYKRYTQTIRAKDDDIRYIPPIEYSYFDPEKGAYDIARSNRVPLEVMPTETLSSADLAIAPDNDATAGPADEALDGLRGNIVNADEILRSQPQVTMTHVVAAAAVPPTLCMLGWLGLVITRRPEGSDSLTRRKNAAKNAQSRIDNAQTPAEISTALSHYLADRFDLPAGTFVGVNAINELESLGLPPATVAQCRDCIERCDNAAYGGGTQDIQELKREAKQCIAEVERNA